MTVINPANFNERVDVPKGALINVHQSDGGRLAFDLVEFDPSGGGSVPDASTSVKGIVKLAADGGTDAGTVVQGNDARLVGGGGVQTATVTLTTDPDTFVASHLFDLGAGPHMALITMTGLVLTTDGETFGNDSGTIFAGIAIIMSSDNVDYTDVGSYFRPVNNFVVAAGSLVWEVQAINAPASAVGISARYLHITMSIQSNDTGTLYAGANHPTAQVQIDVSYR